MPSVTLSLKIVQNAQKGNGMDNFKVIYRILWHLERAMDYDEADMEFISAENLRISRQRWIAIMEMLAREGYVAGIEVKHPADGEICLSLSDVRITLKGLEYLQENSLMQKAAKLAKGIAEIVP